MTAGTKSKNATAERSARLRAALLRSVAEDVQVGMAGFPESSDSDIECWSVGLRVDREVADGAVSYCEEFEEQLENGYVEGDEGDEFIQETFGVDADGKERQSLQVARAQLYYVDNEEAGASVRDQLDAISADLDTFGCLFDADGDLVEELAAKLAGYPGGGVLIADKVRVQPEWRGLGLGPYLLAEAICRLSRGCSITAAYPAAYELERGTPERAAEQQRLEKLWKRLGFRKWQNGTWFIDMDLQPLFTARARLYEHVHTLGRSSDQLTK